VKIPKTGTKSEKFGQKIDVTMLHFFRFFRV